MAPKYHPTPLSGGDRKALNKELGKARAMANILASQSAEMRAKGEAMIQQADKLLCESWNERMWSDGEPIDPSTRPSMAAFHGWRSSAPGARRRATTKAPIVARRRVARFFTILWMMRMDKGVVWLAHHDQCGVEVEKWVHFKAPGDWRPLRRPRLDPQSPPPHGGP
jgi:hypothetical protein